MALKAGVVGLGMIGGGVSQSLAKAGYLVAVYDVNPDAITSFPDLPEISATPADVARKSDVVFIAVVSAAQAIAALSGPDGLLAGRGVGLTVVLLSTVALSDLARIRDLVTDAGAVLIDSGVTSNTVAAERQIICLVGAEQADFDRVKPLFDAFSCHVALMGGPNAGMIAKIARNVMVYGVWRAGYEAALLASAAGIDAHKLAAAVEIHTPGVGNPTGWLLRPDVSDPVERKFKEQSDLLVRKDLDAALELAGDLGVSLPMVELARRTSRSIVRLEP